MVKLGEAKKRKITFIDPTIPKWNILLNLLEGQ